MEGTLPGFVHRARRWAHQRNCRIRELSWKLLWADVEGVQSPRELVVADRVLAAYLKVEAGLLVDAVGGLEALGMEAETGRHRRHPRLKVVLLVSGEIWKCFPWNHLASRS